MKTFLLIITAAAVIAATVAASNPRQANSPADIDPQRWVALGDQAGFVLGPVPPEASGTVAVHLWVKTPKGWRRASLENNAYFSMVPAHP